MEGEKLKLSPLPGYVLIEPTKEEEKTTGGLYMPEGAKEKPAKGKVVGVGDKVRVDGEDLLCPVKIDEIVIYQRWAGQDLKENEKEYRLVKFQDIMAVYGK